MVRRRAVGAVTARGAIVLVALAATSAQAARVVDDTGAAVELRAPARRIVTLAPHAAELVAAAGAAARLVAVGARTDQPPQARDLPVVGDANAIDVERIVALAPDLVVTWPWTAPAQVARLRDRGIPVFTTAPRTIDAIAGDIERLGVLAGTGAAAARSAGAFRARLAALADGARSRSNVRVFYQLSDAPLYTIGAGHTITQAIALCGGENVFAHLPLIAPEVDAEAVLRAKPDVVVTSASGAKPPVWLRDARFAVVPADLIQRHTPRLLDGAEQVCRILEGVRAARS